MRSPRDIAEERQRLNDLIRSFFRDRGFIEVETPALVACPDLSPNLAYFETTLTEPGGPDRRAALITSPEFSMKKLLGAGMEKIFTLAKVFRNEEALGGAHNPEFTMLEWYRQGEGYQACMDETEALVRHCAKGFGKEFPAFRRARLTDLFRERGLDLDDLPRKGDDTESDAFHRAFLDSVEPNLGADPVFVHDYPRHQAALSRLTPDGLYGERFELYVGGLELCNGFTELTDAEEQRRRFEEEAEERTRAGKPVYPIDEDLLRLLPSLRNPTYGNALGVDRLHMLLTGRMRIEDVIPFPANNLFS